MNSKTWVAKLALAVAVPAGLLLGTEGVLRILDRGYPPSFLRPVTIEGRAMWVNNPFYGYRFFEPRMARNPAPIHIDWKKPDGRIRIAVLGESAAMGDPAIEFSLARALEKHLNAPGQPRRFEVINAAMTAINSPVVADIATELAGRDVDVFVIYMGNNEVVGPFGPGTALTSGYWGGRLVRWRVAASRLRLAGLLRDLAAGVAGSAHEPRSWGGMEMFDKNRVAVDDPRLTPMYRNFRDNLARILDAAERNGVKVVLCSMAVNLTDCAPFGSADPEALPRDRRREWETRFREGRKAHLNEQHAEALNHYREAMAIDDRHAELVYRAAHAMAATGQGDEARSLFERARDLDTLRFRTDSTLNRIIRDAAERPGLVFVDIEQAFRTGDDRDLFVDHVHFSMSGLHLLSREIATALRTWYDGPEVTGQAELMRRLFRTPWSDRKELALMLARRSQPPFTLQWGNPERIAESNNRLEQIHPAIEQADLAATGAEVERQREAYPDDPYYLQQWGHILSSGEDWARAADVLQDATAVLYGYSDIHNFAALATAMAGDPEEAATLLVATGPPYGYYLAEAGIMVTDMLIQRERRELVGPFVHVLLEDGGRFAGRALLEQAAAAAGAGR